MGEPRPQPCLTRREGGVCQGTLLPVTDREWRCTEDHTMWGSPGVMRSHPWPADIAAQRKIVLQIEPRTWRMRLTDARVWWWWRLRGRRENFGEPWTIDRYLRLRKQRPSLSRRQCWRKASGR